ncbi:MAG: PD40 domain-containing protein [Acidobacteria bacterium]|nr:PD40 domain-containing protein [Acidobacteriota bacterium]
MQVSAAGGTPQELTTLEEGEFSHRWPEVLPDGKAVLFPAGTGPAWEQQQTVVQSLETGERRALIPGATYARYVPTGHLVYVQSATPGTLLSVPFDLARLEVTGAPFPVVEGVMMSPITYTPQFSFSHLGVLVYVSGNPQALGNTLVWVDRKGAVEPLPAPPQPYDDLRLSPDGEQVTAQVNTDIRIYDIPRQTLTRLTFEGFNNMPLWTPDGKQVTFGSTRAGGAENLFWKPADGSGAAERLTTSEYLQWATSWSPDGQVLAFTESHPTSGADIWVLPLEGERKPRPFLRTPFNEGGAMFSPDGRWLAYASDESGRYEVYVQSFPVPGQKWQISTEGGVYAVWARSGRELFYRNGNKMMGVDVTMQAGFDADTPTLLFEGPYQSGTPYAPPDYDITSDGQRFLMVQLGDMLEASQINVVLNWFEELKQRVPTN